MEVNEDRVASTVRRPWRTYAFSPPIRTVSTISIFNAQSGSVNDSSVARLIARWSGVNVSKILSKVSMMMSFTGIV